MGWLHWVNLHTSEVNDFASSWYVSYRTRQPGQTCISKRIAVPTYELQSIARRVLIDWRPTRTVIVEKYPPVFTYLKAHLAASSRDSGRRSLDMRLFGDPSMNLLIKRRLATSDDYQTFG